MLIITLLACNQKDNVLYSKNNCQIITKNWMIQSKTIIHGQIKIQGKSRKISSKVSEINIIIFDTDSLLQLISVPYKLEKDTILIDTLKNEIIGHNQYYHSQNDTVFIKFKTSSDTLKVWNKPLNLLYKKNHIFYYIDTTFKYYKNLKKDEWTNL